MSKQPLRLSKVEYKIIERTTGYDMQVDVQHLLRCGWRLSGSLIVKKDSTRRTPYLYIQAMTRNY